MSVPGSQLWPSLHFTRPLSTSSDKVLKTILTSSFTHHYPSDSIPFSVTFSCYRPPHLSPVHLVWEQRYEAPVARTVVDPRTDFNRPIPRSTQLISLTDAILVFSQSWRLVNFVICDLIILVCGLWCHRCVFPKLTFVNQVARASAVQNRTSSSPVSFELRSSFTPTLRIPLRLPLQTVLSGIPRLGVCPTQLHI